MDLNMIEIGLAHGRDWIGTGLALDWHRIGIRLDWNGFASATIWPWFLHQIGAGLASNLGGFAMN